MQNGEGAWSFLIGAGHTRFERSSPLLARNEPKGEGRGGEVFNLRLRMARPPLDKCILQTQKKSHRRLTGTHNVVSDGTLPEVEDTQSLSQSMKKS